MRWRFDALDEFRTALEHRIRRRRGILAPPAIAENATGPFQSSVNAEWLERNRDRAHAGLQHVGLPGFWETVVTTSPQGEWPQLALRQAVEASTIRTFGWPIGISFDRDGERPQPTAGGVVAEVAIPEGYPRLDRRSYDYWNLQRTGDFYYLRYLFEDSRGQLSEIFFNTRIVQVTEMLMFLARLYGQQLQLADPTVIAIKMVHGGLQGRWLTAIGKYVSNGDGPCAENEIETTLTTTVADLEIRLVENVKELLVPVFTLFNFATIADPLWSDIVDRFAGGEV